MNFENRPHFSQNCSTWNTFLFAVALTLGAFNVSCEKKDPKPELKDGIYQDMIAQQGEADRISKETDAKIAEIRKNVRGARPQTGLQQKADRQIIELVKLKDKMAQQSIYWKLRTYERLKYVRLKALKQTDGYKPDSAEWAAYNSEKKLRMAKNAWDVKARFRETGFEYDPILLGENPADAPKKAPPPPAHGEAPAHH